MFFGLSHFLLCLVSCSRDEETSADVSNVASFSLPDPKGRAGGACTSAMLKVLYADHKAPDQDLSFQDVLLQMRQILKQGRYTQIPQLSSSRPLDIHHKFDLIPDNFSGGTKRAVLIGINYVGEYPIEGRVGKGIVCRLCTNILYLFSHLQATTKESSVDATMMSET